MAKEPKQLHVKQPETAQEAIAAAKPDAFPVDVTLKQVDAVRQYITGRLKQHIQEITYSYQPNAIAGMMSDLRALNFIAAMDASDKGIVTGPTVDNDAAAKAQAAERTHNAIEARRLAG